MLNKRVLAGVAALLILAALAVVAGPSVWRRLRPRARAAEAAPPPPGNIFQIADRLYVIPGGGGNTAVFVTSRGTVVVDPKFPANGQAVIDQVRRVTQTPITHVIATHGHNDHFGGIAAMGNDVEVVLQEQTAKNIAALRRTDDAGHFDGRHVVTFTDRLRLFDGRDAVELYYFGRGHTNGDVIVVFPDAHAMHAGDLFPGKRNPIVNLSRGGNAHDFPQTLQHAAVGLLGVSRVITGHGDVLSWQDFTDYGDFVRLLVTHVENDQRAGLPWNASMKSFDPTDRFRDYDLTTLYGTVQDIYKSDTPWWKVWAR